jgi:tRNA (cytidine/uridine-2'-O-)-methyltransferase
MSRNLHVVLVEPEIHWNTGNAGRTCLAADAQLHLVGPLGFLLDDKNLKRAGLDYWGRVQPVLWPDWTAFSTELPRLGPAYFFSGKTEKTLWEVRFPMPCVLIFGRESVGLPDALLAQHADRTLAIPMAAGSVRSLNLSTAVGIAGFEVLRQWRS